MGRRSRQDQVSGQQGYVAAQISQDIGDIERHLGQRAFLDNLAVDIGPYALLSDIDAAHDAGADRAEAIHPLHAQHRSCIGVAEILGTDVVHRGKAGNVVPHLVAANVAHWLTNDHTDFAFIVEILAVGRAGELAAV